MNRTRLEGKVAIVTGATGGIGEATAKRFLEEGASVMLVGRSAEKLNETAGRLRAVGPLDIAIADAADETATAAAVEAANRLFGGVDILIANAGTEGKFAPVENLTISDFEDVLRTNVIGVWLSMKHCVEPLKARGGGGSIIAISSIAGMIGSPTMSPYIASKHAVYGLVKLRRSNCPFGVRVNAIGPGPIDNRMMRGVESQFNPADIAAAHEFVLSLVPMQRYGTNEEVASLALFLASDESSYCTGGIHMIDGGFTAQ